MIQSETIPQEACIQALVESSLDDDKAIGVKVINLEGKSSMADAMIIASGQSQRHLSSMADHILRKLKNIGIKGIAVEGLQQCDWVLIDAGDIIVHLFKPEVREHYNLEKMWDMMVSDTEKVSA